MIPSLRLCVELLRLRRRLPRLVAELPLDRLLVELEALPLRKAERSVLDRSILTTEAFVRRSKVVADGCLYRALSRYAVLRANGAAAAFCMGVKPPPHAHTGHAWVEDAGGPYLEAIADGAYVVTFVHPIV